jgi:hypothetical protein
MAVKKRVKRRVLKVVDLENPEKATQEKVCFDWIYQEVL